MSSSLKRFECEINLFRNFLLQTNITTVMQVATETLTLKHPVLAGLLLLSVAFQVVTF
jgi:hypothetical protein